MRKDNLENNKIIIGSGKYKISSVNIKKKEMLGMLEEAVARELKVSIRYMYQHMMFKGVKEFAINEELEEIAITEMQHLEKIGEKVIYLGGNLPTMPYEDFAIQDSFKGKMMADIKEEEDAIKLYKEIIKVADLLGDFATKEMMMKILADEEEHHDFFISVLEESE